MAGEAAGAHLAPTLGFLPWLQGSLSVLGACSTQRCRKGQLCLLQPLLGVLAWKTLGSAAVPVCTGTSTAGHELIFMALCTAV